MNIALLIFIGIELFLLLFIIINSTFMVKLASPKQLVSTKKISVLIPLRDEEKNVPDLVNCLKQIKEEPIEFLLLNDHSSDNTKSLLLQETSSDPRFQIIDGKELPEGWNGKVYACHQLSEHASGDYLLYLDADVRVSPTAISKTIATMQKYKAGMISGFPKYPVGKRRVQLLVTIQQLVIHLHLPLFIANRTNIPSFTAAFGGFLAFDRLTYDDIGGHKAVKGSIIEDVHLARIVKSKNHRMILANLTTDVTCYMYDSLQEAWSGFTKNIFEGIGRSTLLALGISLFYMFVYLLPVIGLGIAFITGNALYLLPLLLSVFHKMYVDHKTKTNLSFGLFMPISALLLIGVLWWSMYKSITGKAYIWKGRFYY